MIAGTNIRFTAGPSFKGLAYPGPQGPLARNMIYRQLLIFTLAYQKFTRGGNSLILSLPLEVGGLGPAK